LSKSKDEKIDSTLGRALPGKSKGSITVPSTSCKTRLDMAVVDINNNFLYYLVRPAFWEVDSTRSFPLLL